MCQLSTNVLELDQDDADVIMIYMADESIKRGVEGSIRFSLRRLQEIHYENSISIANEGITKCLSQDP